MSKLPDLTNIIVKGPFWSAEAEVLRVSTPAPTPPGIFFSENFETYSENQDPTDWRDTNADYSFKENTRLFKTAVVEGTKVFGTTSSLNYIHSHYSAPGVLHWTNYVFTGRMYTTNSNSGVGVTFFSRYPENHEEYYILKRSVYLKDFRITRERRREIGGKTTSGVKPKRKTWYRFLIEVEDTGSRTNIKAKVWEDGKSEPLDFQIDAYDASANRLTSGTVGVCTVGTGSKYFDDFKVQETYPKECWTFRNLFVDNTPRNALNDENLFLPGSLLTLCFVKKVCIRPGRDTELTYVWKRDSSEKPLKPSLQEIKDLLGSGRLSLMLIQADPAQWSTHLPEFTCLNGNINLNALNPDDEVLDKLYHALNLESAEPGSRKGAAGLAGALSVHSSGLSIYGKIFLPWEKDRIAAPLQLTRLLPDPAIPSLAERLPGFRLTIDLDRLTPDEKSGLTKAWKNLSTYLNPKHPLNRLSEPPKTSNWVTFEITDPLNVPHIYWQIAPWQEDPGILPLHVERDEINVLLSDQQPYDKKRTPTSLGIIVPSDTSITPDQNGGVQISVQAGSASETPSGKIVYEAHVERNNPWQESFELSNIDVTFDPVETPRLLRNNQELPTPDTLVGRGSLPKHIKTIAIPIFENDTLKEGVEEVITQTLIDVYVRGGKVRLVPETEADAILRGKIRSYTSDEALTDDELDEASSYKLTVAIDAELKDLANDEFIWRTENLTEDTNFEEGPDVDIGTEQKNEEKALQELAQDLAERILALSDDQPPVLWGFMPLEDGWAQLPVPNLTEQLYLDVGLAQSEVQPSPKRAALLQGAVSYGNDNPQVLASHRNEQLWNVTLLNMNYIAGKCKLQPDTRSKGFTLVSITMEIFSPEVILNGLFWLSTGKPSIADALPDFENWISGLQSIPLKTLKPETDLFPAPLTLTFNRLSFSLRYASQVQSGQLPSALLKDWSFLYKANPEVFKNMVAAGLLPLNTFSRHLPLIWRRHRYLPMIQVLPLTQSKSPPNVPNASRQLAPFELARIADSDNDHMVFPKDWLFGVSGENGAVSWPRLLSEAVPAREWRSLSDLPLASLSLPGLVLDPNASPETTGLVLNPTDLLPLQYRFDLPYTDEINALAQLPKVLRNPEEVSPLPDSPPPDPEKPLSRESLAEHWQRLTERANLASADAIAAFVKENDHTCIRHLIEPFNWLVQSAFDLSQYPGTLTLENDSHDQPATIVLESETALKGISGKFIEDGNDQWIRRLDENDQQEGNPYVIEAGSMAAYRHENGTFRDQRGLQRSASIMLSNLVKTPVILYGDGIPSELISALSSFDLHVTEGHVWQFWFRDLPVQSETFNRHAVLSDEAEDVNDPEAHSRKYNYLTGYEWRLADKGTEADPSTFLSLFNLRFYPLTLEKVIFANDHVTRLEIIGRLQLPLNNGNESKDFSNAARITFEYDNGSDQLKFTALAAESEVGEWPLALHGGESGDSPRLFWKKISLSRARDTIDVDEVALNFFLFGAEWSIQLGELSFPREETTITNGYAFPQGDLQEHIAPKQLDLSLDLISGTFNHTVSLALMVQLDSPEPERPRFTAKVCFHLLGEDQGGVVWKNGSLFEDINLLPQSSSEDDPSILFTEKALQFKWQIDAPPNLQLLPGMHIHSKNAPGFAALTFDVLTPLEGIPKLHLKTAFLETLLFCRWGNFLQQEHIQTTGDRQQIFGSSTGDLSFAYTAQWHDGKWDESFLLNGFLEVKNLISWPEGMTYAEDESTLTLPNARVSNGTEQPELNHIRHTIRILFNQHFIPTELLIVEKGELLFNLAEDRTWQFLSVVEHQLIDVYPNPEFDSFDLKNDRRWTALQEVRLILPETFKDFLLSHEMNKTTAPIEEIDWIGDVSYGYLGAGLREKFTKPDNSEIDKMSSKTLLVEASAPHWIKQELLSDVSMTTLQFLPNGTQLAIASNPQDYAPSDQRDPKWLLLTTPFLGRLQDESNDLLKTPDAIADSVSALQVDPLFRIHYNRVPDEPLPSIPLAFCTWGDDTPVEIGISDFDFPPGRLWPRLDPTSLEENWFRLQNPLPEPPSKRLQSVMAAMPDTPARLSRSTALQRAFDAFRRFYPPAHCEMIIEPEETDQILWRQKSLMLMQGVSSINIHSDPPYGWHLAGLQIVCNDFSKADTHSENTPRRYAAATLLPALLNIDDRENRMPLSFTVSPYLGFEFRPSGSEPELRLISAELLCFDRGSDTLRPVASHFWEQGDEDIISLSLKWARETHRRICPDSPLAIVRFREIRESMQGDTEIEALLTTTYSFSIVPGIGKQKQLARRVFRIRSAVSQLRFREGQFGGYHMPKHVKAFEIAAPQVVGVQPVYLSERPAADTPGTWPWGLSSLRISIRYTIQKHAAIGHLCLCSANELNDAGQHALTLWWQAPQHFVQYRSAISSDRPTAGLPSLFRASAIKSFLPVLPDLPLPVFDVQNLIQISEAASQRWQPVLPGAVRYMLLGTRAGVMFAIRHQLLRQSGLAVDNKKSQEGEKIVSGSVPVQHRMPRPVLLPDNQQRETALQTWASYFEAEKNVIASKSPIDEAFFAAFKDEQARRLQMKLERPVHGLIHSKWKGELDFEINFEKADVKISDWKIILEVIDHGETFEYQTPTTPDTPDNANVYRFTLAEDKLKGLKDHINSKIPGEILLANAQVKHKDSIDGFSQTLSFPLRIFDETALPLPLEPSFIHFEDPEYNRRLSSSSAHAEGMITINRASGPELHTITLSTDRKEYNPDSLIAVRYDWDDNISRGKATLELQRIDSNGVVTDLLKDSNISNGQLKQHSLLEIIQNDSNKQLQLIDGDTLQLKLTVKVEEAQPEIFLNVSIVEEPVIPVPEAAYALLRWQKIDGEIQVECVRFAWGPEASRIELVCPEDLRTEVVRRRAMFQWNDSVRVGMVEGYAIQKITPTGSTHFPSPEPLKSSSVDAEHPRLA